MAAAVANLLRTTDVNDAQSKLALCDMLNRRDWLVVRDDDDALLLLRSAAQNSTEFRQTAVALARFAVLQWIVQGHGAQELATMLRDDARLRRQWFESYVFAHGAEGLARLDNRFEPPLPEYEYKTLLDTAAAIAATSTFLGCDRDQQYQPSYLAEFQRHVMQRLSAVRHRTEAESMAPMPRTSAPAATFAFMRRVFDGGRVPVVAEIRDLLQEHASSVLLPYAASQDELLALLDSASNQRELLELLAARWPLPAAVAAVWLERAVRAQDMDMVTILLTSPRAHVYLTLAAREQMSRAVNAMQPPVPAWVEFRDKVLLYPDVFKNTDNTMPTSE